MTREDRSSRPGTAAPADPGGILTSIGLVPYDWRIETDALTWGANAAEVLQIADIGQIATGRGFARSGPRGSRYSAQGSSQSPPGGPSARTRRSSAGVIHSARPSG